MRARLRAAHTQTSHCVRELSSGYSPLFICRTLATFLSVVSNLESAFSSSVFRSSSMLQDKRSMRLCSRCRRPDRTIIIQHLRFTAWLLRCITRQLTSRWQSLTTRRRDYTPTSIASKHDDASSRNGLAMCTCCKVGQRQVCRYTRPVMEVVTRLAHRSLITNQSLIYCTNNVDNMRSYMMLAQCVLFWIGMQVCCRYNVNSW